MVLVDSREHLLHHFRDVFDSDRHSVLSPTDDVNILMILNRKWSTESILCNFTMNDLPIVAGLFDAIFVQNLFQINYLTFLFNATLKSTISRVPYLKDKSNILFSRKSRRV